ncbi:MAG: nodulation protein NfeD [Xanthomonadaceae bacterium]|nr:nodulation protein NfeD [Xanthomonadaceae bacterium]
MCTLRNLLGSLAIAVGLTVLVVAGAAPEDRVVLLSIDDGIGPATSDYYQRGVQEAAASGATAVVLQLNTPGGLDSATRDIVAATLAAEVPVIMWVAPGGARAASAGTYMLYASHVAAMAPATNLGAATPVAIGGSTPAPGPDDTDDGKDEAPTGDAMSRKAINDSVAYIKGLAELRGRNAEWAERAVRQAESLTAREALEINVIDVIAATLDDLLTAVDGREVETARGTVALRTAGAEIQTIEPDWRNRFLATITNPSIAYILMIIGLYGLLLEGYNPGGLVPGIVGAISLLLAAYALQLLPVNYVGLALVLLGVGLIVAETFVPSFGILGMGGIVALAVGGVILMDTDVPGFAVSHYLIGTISIVAGGALLATLLLANRVRKKPVATGQDQLLGAVAIAVEDFEATGHVRLFGERWNATAATPVRAGQAVRVIAINGLTLHVTPEQ